MRSLSQSRRSLALHELLEFHAVFFASFVLQLLELFLEFLILQRAFIGTKGLRVRTSNQQEREGVSDQLRENEHSRNFTLYTRSQSIGNAG
jgi:hypothetical protein